MRIHDLPLASDVPGDAAPWSPGRAATATPAPVTSQTTLGQPVRDAVATPAGASVAPIAPAPGQEPVGGAAWIAATRFVPLSSAEVAAKLVSMVRERVRNGGPPPVVVFDLDYTLYNNDPRTVRVLREWAATEGAAAFPKVRDALAAFEERNVRYSAADCVRAAGFTAEETAAVMKSLLPFFLEKFLDNEHTAVDPLIPEVGGLAVKLADAGARVVFLTGRIVAQQGAGTLETLRRDGLTPDDKRYFLFLKPTATKPDGSKYADTEFKADVKPEIEKLGEVVGTLDNEPANVVGFSHVFPNAMNVFVDTKWSEAKVQPAEGLYRYVPGV